MTEAQISYGTYAFHDHGAALYGLTRRYENASDGRPTAILYDFTVTLQLTRDSFSDIEAQIKTLRTYLDSNTESSLLIKDENGATLHQRTVRVVSDTVPEDWRQYVGTIAISFTCRDNSPATAAVDATFTPSGGIAITLPNITSWSESIRATRFHPERTTRRDAREVIDASGIILADESLSESERRAWLIAEKNKIQAVNDSAADGVLAFGGQERTCEIERIDANLSGDGSHQLQWTLSLYRERFLDDDYAEAEFEVAPSTNQETGEVTLSVSGTIRADNFDGAETKLAAIRAHYLTGRALLVEDHSDQHVSGQDTSDDLPGEFLQRSFTLRYRDTNASVLNWELKVSTRDDERSQVRTLTYSGRVIAATASAALDKARALGDAKHDFPLTSSEELSYRKMGEGDTERFIECAFSYDYQTRTQAIFAEVSSQTSRDRFGSWSITVSGSVAAPTLSAAETRGRAFKLAASYLQTGEQESNDTTYYNPGAIESTQFQRFTFSYGYLIPSTTTSVEYAKTESRDFEALETRISYDGICRGADKATCAAYVSAIISPPSSARKLAEVFTENYKRVGNNQVLDGYRFTYAYMDDLSSASAPSTIIDAEVTVDTTYSVDHSVITPIPYGTPFVQTNVGTTPGSVRISGQVSGYSIAALTGWARDKRALRPASGHEEPPQETITRVSPKFQPTGTKLYRLSFSYPYQYAVLEMT